MKFSLVKMMSIVACVAVGAMEANAQQTAALGAQTTAPIGWVQFCRDMPKECDTANRRAATISLNETSWRRIVKINADVNREIIAVTDMDHWGVPENWSYPTDGKGDCEDFVLEKRRRLVEAGFPVQALLITVVRDLKGDGHAVLTVKTDRGDYILDNQEGKILSWQETGYRFIKRQSEENVTKWVSLGGIDTRTVASQR